MAFEKLYSVEEIAEMTSVTTRTIRNYLRNGILTGTKIGGQWRFRQEDVMNMLNQENMSSDVRETSKRIVKDFLNEYSGKTLRSQGRDWRSDRDPSSEKKRERYLGMPGKAWQKGSSRCQNHIW